MIDDILKDRENRYNTVLELINQYQLPVVCSKINYPGSHKNTPEALKAFQVLEQLVISGYGRYSTFTKVLSGGDGRSLLMVVTMTPLEAKKIALDLEDNHPLGRIFDIDVYHQDGSPISRGFLGLESRRCILCNEDARVCMRKKSHILQEIIEGVNNLIRSN